MTTALNFPPTLVARDGTLRRPNHQRKSRSRWKQPSWALANVGVQRPDRIGAIVGQNWVDHSFAFFHTPPPLLTCSMATLVSGSRPRLVGRPLLYTISAFASLGVFLVSCIL